MQLLSKRDAELRSRKTLGRFGRTGFNSQSWSDSPAARAPPMFPHKFAQLKQSFLVMWTIDLDSPMYLQR